MKDGSRGALERILELTLEIISLLTGEDYMIVRKPSDRLPPSDGPPGTQSPSPVPPPHSQKILELTHKMLSLLTGEECEGLDGRGEVIAEDPRPLDSWDGEGRDSSVSLPDSVSENAPKAKDLRLHQLGQSESRAGNETSSREERSFRVAILGIHAGYAFTACKEQQARRDVRRDISLRTRQAETVSAAREETTLKGEDDFTDHYDLTERAFSPTKGEPDLGEEGDLSEADTRVPGERASHRVKEEPTACEGGTLEDDARWEYRLVVKEEESTSCEEEDLSDPDIHTPAEDAHPEYESVPVKEEPPSGEEGEKVPDLCESGNSDPASNRQAKSFICSFCGKCFTRNGNLIVHRRIHTGEKPYACPDCGKGFTNSSHLSRHQRVHTGDGFSCLECGKYYTDKSSLVKHQRIHTGEKPFSCSVCAKSFTDKSSLAYHQKIHTGEKPFSCSECGKKFINKSHFLRHQRMHRGDRFSCAECGKCFTDKSNLVKHQRIHSGEKPFSCLQCGKSFIERSMLVYHQRVHTGEKPFSCAECGRCFAQSSSRVRHQRIHAKNTAPS